MGVDKADDTAVFFNNTLQNRAAVSRIGYLLQTLTS